MIAAGLLLLAGVAPDRLPFASEAADALLYTMTCRDEDGYTLCDPSMPVAIEFTRFDCVSAPVGHEAELARASCAIAGRIKYTGRRAGEYRWVPLGGDRADFCLQRPVSAHDGARWQAFSGPHG